MDSTVTMKYKMNRPALPKLDSTCLTCWIADSLSPPGSQSRHSKTIFLETDTVGQGSQSRHSKTIFLETDTGRLLALGFGTIGRGMGAAC